MLKGLRIVLFTMVYCCTLIAVARAEYRDLTTLVNVNEQTNLFEEKNEDWSALQGRLEDTRNGILDGVKSNKGIDIITDKSPEEIKRSASGLSSIDAHDLNQKGSEELAKNGLMKDIYVDFKNPLNKQSMIDAKEISSAQDKIMGNLLGKLKEIGVDCKTVKGAVEKEPAYYLQVENSQHKDTVYNQKFCEDLRNSYNCTDSVSLTCKRKGKRYGEWQNRTIRFPGHLLHYYKVNWGYAVHWKKKRWGWHITPYHPRRGDQVDSIWRNNPGAIIADARAYIAQGLQVPIEQIGEQVIFPAGGRGVGNLHPIGHRWRIVWDEYEFKYQFRDAYDVCEEWVENWTERCNVK